MNVREFTDRIMAMEEALRLFPDTRVGEAGWWDVVRHDVMKLAYSQIVAGRPDIVPVLPFATRLRHLAIRCVLRAGLACRSRLGRYDVLVYRAPRLERDGRRIDIGMDQFLPLITGRTLIINTYPHRYDRRFAAASKLAARPAGLDDVEAYLRDNVGVALDLDVFVRQRLADFELATVEYRRLLARVRPRLVLLTQNGIEKGLFRASREAGVPCIEAQHGLINGVHPAYAYPSGVSGEGRGLFPDGLMGLSDFWLRSCHYPVSWTASTGNDAFVPKTMTSAPQDGDVLVITAHKYNERLCEWTQKAASRLPARQFKFKLHPSQGDQKPAIEARMRHLSNVEVIGTTTTTAELMATASDVLLIQSTVAYEAVQAGRRLTVIAEYDSDTHADLFPLPNVHVVTDLESLVHSLSGPSDAAPAPVFFQPFDAEFARDLLSRAARTPPAQMTAGFPRQKERAA